MHIELRAIQRDLGITTILVTHDQVEAMTMSDRIAVMQKGRIVQIDTPYEAYERPHSPFASAFLGKTNAFAGAVQTRNDRCCNVQVKDTLLHVPHEDRSLGNDVNVYIRPEKIRLTEAGRGRLNGRIRLRVFLGNAHGVTVMVHAFYDGPGLLAAVHGSAALGGAKSLVEWRYFDLEAQLYGDAIIPRNGRIDVPQGPGLGIEPDQDVIRDYRFKP
nr:enolase C-terminal domain-like protein [uncultured Pseudomonas sp.]